MFLIYLVGSQAEYLREKAAKKNIIFTKVYRFGSYSKTGEAFFQVLDMKAPGFLQFRIEFE